MSDTADKNRQKLSVRTDTSPIRTNFTTFVLMKAHRHTILAAAALLWAAAANAQNPDWENPEVIGINKLPYHATLNLPSKRAECGEITLLDGVWKFRWSAEPDSRPADFWKEGFDVSGWDDIKVPGNWQTQGFGKPIYTNIIYPFAMDRPKVTSEPPADYYSYGHRDPVGSYVTSFEITEEPGAHSWYLHFDGVKSAMYLWVNGHKVGYSQNSMSPAEFDISPYVRKGSNRLAVEVYRWSDGSYLEDQDMWRLSGIYRSVELWKRPKLHISDYRLRTDLADDHSEAAVKIEFTLRNSGRKRSARQKLSCVIGDNKVECSVPPIKAGATQTLSVSTTIDNPRLWSAEKPELYGLQIELTDGGRTAEHLDYHFGIKKVEIRGNVLYYNGKPIKLRGVNRHEHHPLTGRYVDEATMRRDLELMKQAGVNMVRTSHYPDQPLFYELCDIYGIYVMDEANHESHNHGIGTTTLGDDPQWRKAMTDRAASLAARDLNHPCVIFWSLGNEAAAGDNVHAMRDTILSIDDSRPIYYDSDLSASDIFDDAYASPDRILHMIETVKDKPVMMREYEHAMGNSLGNLKEYWDIFYSHPNAVGGVVWDWVDQGLKCPHPDRLIPLSDFAYGGDFGDFPNDGSFCINGLIGADRIPHPHYYELAKIYQPLYFSLEDTGRIRIDNKDSFTGPDEYDYSCIILLDGREIHSERLSLEDGCLQIPSVPMIEGEAFVNVYAHLRNDKIWAKAGTIIAREQFLLQKPLEDCQPSPGPTPKYAFEVLADSKRAVSCGAQSFLFSPDGDLLSWKYDGREILSAPVEPYFWKAPNENDRRSNYIGRQGQWRNTAAQRRTVSVENATDGCFVLRFRSKLSVGAELVITYRISEESFKVEAEYLPFICFSPSMPKFGFRLGLKEEFSRVAWYGRGPCENYPDRKSGSLIGRYSLPLGEFVTSDYVVPQDNANRCDVRECSFSSENGGTVSIRFDEPGNFRAWPYLEEEIENAKHPSELKPCGYININLDQYIQGVGGIQSWGALPLDKYMVDSHLPYKTGLSFVFRN